MPSCNEGISMAMDRNTVNIALITSNRNPLTSWEGCKRFNRLNKFGGDCCCDDVLTPPFCAIVPRLPAVRESAFDPDEAG